MELLIHLTIENLLIILTTFMVSAFSLPLFSTFRKNIKPYAYVSPHKHTYMDQKETVGNTLVHFCHTTNLLTYFL